MAVFVCCSIYIKIDIAAQVPIELKPKEPSDIQYWIYTSKVQLKA